MSDDERNYRFVNFLTRKRTIPNAAKLLGLTAPPTRKAIDLLEGLGVLREITGKRRGRAYAYHEYLQVLTGDEA